MKANTRRISNLISARVHELDPQAQVILYGSRARGDERVDSDWDILVLTQYPVDLKIEKTFRDHLYDLELETGEPLSLFVFSSDQWNTTLKISPFYHSVMEQGIRL